MKTNWAITTTLACCSMFAGTIMAQQGQRVSTTLDQWANKPKTETASTPTFTANRRIEDVTGLEKMRSRGTNTDVSTTTQANDRRNPNNDDGYNDNRRQPEYNDRNPRNGNYGSRDDDRRRYDDRDRRDGCSKDNHRGGESHGYGRGSANRSNDRGRDDDRYRNRDRDDDRYHDRDRDGKSRRTCDSNGKNRGRGF